jgi:hypothetical protein
MDSRQLLIWTIQGIIALCQGRILYLYSFTSSQHDIRRTILTIALLYASEAFSMTILLLVYHGKRDIRITRHAFWATVIFPVIATVTADILYIKASGRFFLGLFFLIFAAVIYAVAGLGLSMLCIRIFGHSAFRPFTYGKRIPVRSRTARHGSIGSNYTGGRTYSGRTYSDRTYGGRTYGNTEFRGWGFGNEADRSRNDSNTDRKEDTSAATDNRPEEDSKEGYSYFGYRSYNTNNSSTFDIRRPSGSSPARNAKQTEQPHRGSVIIPDYSQEYIDKFDQAYINRMEQRGEDGFILTHPNDRPVYYGGSKSRIMVAYINQDNQLISCDERRTGFGRLGRIASSGEIFEYNGGTEVQAGFVTAAGYIRNAAGLDIGCVDENGNVFRYEGEGALDMTHAKTLVGKVNPGDYSAGAAFLLLAVCRGGEG